MAAGLPAASLFGIGGTNIQDSDEDEDAAAARALGSMNFGRPRSKTSQAKTKLAMAKRKCWGIDDDFDALQWTPKKIIVYFKRFVVPENSQASMPATLRRDIKLHIGGHFSHCETMFELERVPERRQPPWIPKPKSKRAKKQKKKRRVAPSESQTSQYDTDVEDSDGSGNPGPPEAFRMERNAPKRSNRYPTRELNDAMTCHIVVAVKSGGPVRLLDKEAYDSTWVPIILVGMSSKERELIFDAQVQAKGRPFSTTMKFNAVVRFLGCGCMASPSRSLLMMDDTSKWRLSVKELPGGHDDDLPQRQGSRDDDFEYPYENLFCSQLLAMSLYETSYEMHTVDARTSTPESVYNALTALVAQHKAATTGRGGKK